MLEGIGFEDLSSTHAHISPEGKRTRTSPHTKAMNEALQLISAYISEKENEGDESTCEVLEQIKAELEAKRDAGPAVYVPTGRPRGRPAGVGNGGGPALHSAAPHHYVGITHDGLRTYLGLSGKVTAERRDESGRALSDVYVTVLGPFKFKHGAEYRVTNGQQESDTVVF